MCGIAGYISRRTKRNNAGDLIAMARSLNHRGPDDEGYAFINSQTRDLLNCSGAESDFQIRSQFTDIVKTGEAFAHDIGLSHRRYSIIDLSPSGHQPMWDEQENVCLSFNGEIYNYLELRSELEDMGYQFQTHSDTEVFLKAYLQWNTQVFSRLNGPWAAVLYDKKKNQLLLSRDRIGKAPLYYAVQNGCLYWASEIKAILAVCAAGTFAVREQAVDDFLVYDLRDFDGTFWEGIMDFPPACFAWVGKDLSLKIERYWDFPRGRMTANEICVDDAADTLRELLISAITLRMRADVPVAFELSGGMDSSSIVSLTASALSQKISTFTVKYTDGHVDEEPFARAVAQHYKDQINYNVLPGQNYDFWQDADRFVWLEEEPFHSPNLFILQSQRREIKKQGVEVVIAGSAGDEVLAGYPSEYYVPFWDYLMKNHKFRDLIHECRCNTEMGFLRAMYMFLKNEIIPKPIHDHVSRLKNLRRIRNIYLPVCNIVRRSRRDRSFDGTMLDNMTRWKMNYWMRSGNKTTFGIPIEPRTPFLDYRIVEFAFSLPPEYLIHDGWLKWILRVASSNALPSQVVWRKRKMGFPFPLKNWLLQSKVIVEKNLGTVECPYINSKKLMDAYDDLAHRASQHLWRLISLALWWRKFVENKPIVERKCKDHSDRSTA